jgi:poly(hydroxyalkanoate) depolymerase family esterase
VRTKLNNRLLTQLSRASRLWMNNGTMKAAGAAMQRTMEQTMREAGKAMADAAAKSGPAMRDLNPTPPFAAPGAKKADDGAAADVLVARYTGAAGARDYRLYLPDGASPAAPGLIVMLHGCTQDAADFAAGTRMQALARAANCLVLYPQQAQTDNPAKCWNWFSPADQRRGAGEPAIIAGLTQTVMDRHGVDPQRVFVAGLSAGGAMAATLAHQYPDLYRACGVHSGLPHGAAGDVQSALKVMKSGPAAPLARAAQAVPLIVFHGDRDATVSPRNGAAVLRHTLAAGEQENAAPEVETGHSAAGMRYTRSIYRTGEGRTLAEQWVLHGGAHAWSGGSSDGTYTEPRGPDASAEMLRFFLAQAA